MALANIAIIAAAALRLWAAQDRRVIEWPYYYVRWRRTKRYPCQIKSHRHDIEDRQEDEAEAMREAVELVDDEEAKDDKRNRIAHTK